MGQLNFVYNFGQIPSQFGSIVNGTLTFFPLNVEDYVSFNTANILLTVSSANLTWTFSLGLYSLNGSSLSLANSISRTLSVSNSARMYLSLIATSATQNISPGTWYFGFLASTGGNANISYMGHTGAYFANPFPAGFYGGEMTASTNALPASYATSNLDTSGFASMPVPFIIISA